MNNSTSWLLWNPKKFIKTLPQVDLLNEYLYHSVYEHTDKVCSYKQLICDVLSSLCNWINKGCTSVSLTSIPTDIHTCLITLIQIWNRVTFLHLWLQCLCTAPQLLYVKHISFHVIELHTFSVLCSAMFICILARKLSKPYVLSGLYNQM